MGTPTGPVQLVTGKILGMIEGERARFEVRAGRWHNVVTNKERDCAILVQFRIWEGQRSKPFRVVLEPTEVPAVIEGLRRWADECNAGLLEHAFADASPG